jgi:hypothetical protein
MDAAEALCLLEKVFPPTFMDVMFYLMIYLVHELYICGLVHCRWMYAKLEACIVEGYTIMETLGYSIEYMQRFSGSKHWVWDDKEEPCIYDEIV